MQLRKFNISECYEIGEKVLSPSSGAEMFVYQNNPQHIILISTTVYSPIGFDEPALFGRRILAGEFIEKKLWEESSVFERQDFEFNAYESFTQQHGGQTR